MAIIHKMHNGTSIHHPLASALDIPPELVTAAGHHADQALVALKQARDAGGGCMRLNHIAQAQRHIGTLDPQRHGPLVQRLQAHALALQGRGGDTKLAHVSPGEVVIPQRLQTPEVMAALHGAAKAAGLDSARLRVGSSRNKINPRTGQVEFDDDGIEEIVVEVPRQEDFKPSAVRLVEPEVDSIASPSFEIEPEPSLDDLIMQRNAAQDGLLKVGASTLGMGTLAGAAGLLGAPVAGPALILGGGAGAAALYLQNGLQDVNRKIEAQKGNR